MSNNLGNTTLNKQKEKSNQAPDGYRFTEIGIIPKDWDIFTINDIFTFLKTTSYSRSQLSEDGKIKYIHYGDIHTKWEHFIDFHKHKIPFLNQEMDSVPTLLKNGDIIIADASEDEEGVGKSVEVKNIGDDKAIAGLHTILLRAKDKTIIKGFRGYLLDTPYAKFQLRRLATGLKVFGISKNVLKKIAIPVPSSNEQRAIATALSDTDNLIESLEKLIAKKQDIKKATMQQLLTGKKRLPGFEREEKWDKQNNLSSEFKHTEVGEISGDWDCMKISDAYNFKQGVQCPIEYQSKIKGSNQVRFIRIVDLTQDSEPIRYIKDPGKNEHVKNTDLFMVRYGSPGIVGIGYDGVIANNLFRLLPKKKLDNKFFYYYLMYIRNDILNVSGSSTMSAINFSALNSLPILFPQPEEQTAIADILTNMDNEIEALERRLKKTKQIKQGMMQDLLTGKIRLKQQVSEP